MVKSGSRSNRQLQIVKSPSESNLAANPDTFLYMSQLLRRRRSISKVNVHKGIKRPDQDT